ncbi:hypothetical protein [Legionella hackeliae]|uniref:hypothetical protein n=1 Tax=Legionella hackeliae TaxID=449 RepID=UPI0011C065E2|nr:hypothetical protein [Legionella hackeliae]
MQLSEVQTEKTIFDLYSMIVGPLGFLLLLFFFEKIKITSVTPSIPLVNLNLIYIVFIILYCVVSVHIESIVGWRITAIQAEHRIISGDRFVVPFFSGFWSILGWSLVILAPYVRKRYAITAIALIFIISGILHVKRGDIIRVLLFFIIYYVSTSNIQVNKQTHRYLILFALSVITVVIFVIFGQWRLAQSGNDWQTIINISGVRINSAFVAWLFGYLIIQFDVFSLSTKALASPLYVPNDWGVLMTSDSLPTTSEMVPINGFNAATAFWDFVRDYGALFWLEMFIFWGIAVLLLGLSKKTNCKSAYCFTAMLCALMIFGNYFASRSIVLAIVVSNLIFFISNKNQKLISQ